MGIIRELRDFMAEMRQNGTSLRVLQSQIRRLEKQNSELHDRLMARDFEHFKAYQPTTFEPAVGGQDFYSIQSDETSAGMVLSDEAE